jgi:hypothetical protein
MTALAFISHKVTPQATFTVAPHAKACVIA